MVGLCKGIVLLVEQVEGKELLVSVVCHAFHASFHLVLVLQVYLSCFQHDVRMARGSYGHKAAVEVEGVTMKEAMKTYNFYAIMGVFLLFGLCFYLSDRWSSINKEC